MTAVSPKDWDNVRLGDIGQSLIGLTYSPSSVKPSGTLVLRSSNIQKGRLDFDDCVYVNSPIPDKIRIRKNDVLICVRNGSRRLIGKSVILDDRAVGETFGAFMSVFRSDANVFLQYFFQSDDFKRQINEHLGATINQITNGSLNSFVVALPGSAEQLEIAARLDDVDSFVATLERLIVKKQAIKQGTMQQLLSGNTRLHGFTSEWVSGPLGKFMPLQRGFDLPVSDVIPGKYPVVYSNGVSRYHATAMVKGPGVATGRSGTIGNVHYVESDYWPHNTALWVTSFARTDPKFVYYFLTYLGLERFASGSGVPTFNRNDAHALEIQLPSQRDEQVAIASVISAIDGEISMLLKRLKKAKSIKQGMMQELLSGRTRLQPAEVAV